MFSWRVTCLFNCVTEPLQVVSTAALAFVRTLLGVSFLSSGLVVFPMADLETFICFQQEIAGTDLGYAVLTPRSNSQILTSSPKCRRCFSPSYSHVTDRKICDVQLVCNGLVHLLATIVPHSVFILSKRHNSVSQSGIVGYRFLFH